MLIWPETWQALTDAGVTLVPQSTNRIELRYQETAEDMALLVSAAPLSPSDISALGNRHPGPALLVMPSATPAARATAEAAHWSWLVADGRSTTGILRIGGHRITVDSRAETPERLRRRPGRVPWGTFALVRRLVERPYASQQQLAALSGISQPRASQTLRALMDRRLVTRTAAGWAIRQVDEIVQWWLDSYPGPGGISTYWYGLDQPLEQARNVVGLLDARLRPLSPELPVALVSGDVAADFIAPWRSPSRAVIYARNGLDLTEAGLTPAGINQATLELILPQDPGLWPTSDLARQIQRGLPLADPLQVLWDLRRSPGSDTDEAVARLRQTLSDRTPSDKDSAA
jgi:hypothetical protein